MTAQFSYGLKQKKQKIACVTSAGTKYTIFDG
jgi:hypothetical protein